MYWIMNKYINKEEYDRNQFIKFTQKEHAFPEVFLIPVCT